MAVRGFLWRVLAMTSWSGTCASPRWVDGGVAELVEVEPGVLLEEDAGAIVAEAGAAGVRADVLGAGPAGGSWFAVGQEQRSAGADGAVGEAQQPG